MPCQGRVFFLFHGVWKEFFLSNKNYFYIQTTFATKLWLTWNREKSMLKLLTKNENNKKHTEDNFSFKAFDSHFTKNVIFYQFYHKCIVVGV